MSLLRRFPILAFTLVLLSIAAVSAAQQSVGLLLIAATLAAISWYITEGPRGRVLPRWVSNVLIIAATLNVFYELLSQRAEILGVLGRFGVWLTIIKLFERRSASDYAHLLTLSLILVMTACLTSNTLLIAIILVVYAGLGLNVLLLYQMYAAFERARQQRQEITPADYRLIPPLKPIMGRHPVLHFRAQALGIAAVGLLISLLVFVAFPRDVGANMFHVADGGASVRTSGARVTQFSWSVDLNAGGRITESTAEVLTLRILSGTVPAGEPLLLRGAVLEEYSRAGRWSTRVGQQPPLVGLARPVSQQAMTDVIVQQIVLAKPIEGVAPIFSLYAPIAVSLDEQRAIAPPLPMFPPTVHYDVPSQTLRTSEAVKRLRSHVVVSDASPADELLQHLAIPARPHVRSLWFGPRDLAILRELADAKLTAAGLPASAPSEPEIWQWNRQAAAVFTEWLHSSEFTYTTDLSGIVYPSPQTDPIVAFLTSTKRGHCEFFASALAALCHSKGIPARLVAGYVAIPDEHARGQYSVLERNAHAWVEVATGEGGGCLWSTFDPTPAATLITQHQRSIAQLQQQDESMTFVDRLRRTFGRLESAWGAAVVDFNRGVQSQLADAAARAWSERFAATFDSVRDWMRRVNQAFYFGPAGYIWMGIVVLALAIAILALVKLMRRSLAIRRTARLQHVRGPEYQRLLRHLGFYLDMLEVLRRAGLAKPHWQPPLQFAAELASRPPTESNGAIPDTVRRLTDVFYQARYGGHRLTRQELTETRQLVQELAASLRVKM